MTDNDMDLMNRYIYEVVRHIPKKQREEISMELRELIEDMAEENGMAQVLETLGDPKKLAGQYRDETRYIISPDYYDNYIWVLKIVMACILFSAVVSFAVEGIVDGTWAMNRTVDGFLDHFIDSILDLSVDACLSAVSAFGIVTLIFAILERQHVKVELMKENSWSVDDLNQNVMSKKIGWTPAQLAPVPDKRALISRSDSVLSIIFVVITSGLCILAPHLLGAYVINDGEIVKTIPIVNLDQWHIILPFLLAGLFLCFVDEMIRLVTGYYCKAIMFSNIIAGLLQLVLGIIILKVLPFWNPSFITDVKEAFGYTASSKGDILFYYGTDTFSNIILSIMLAVTLLEAGITIYKTLHYGVDR